MKTLLTLILFSTFLALPAFTQQQQQAPQDPEAAELANKEKELAALRIRREKHQRELQSKLIEGITASSDDVAQLQAKGFAVKLRYEEEDPDYKPTTFVWHVLGPNGFDQFLSGQNTSVHVKETGPYTVLLLAQDGSGDGRNQRQHVLKFTVNPVVEWEKR